MFYKELNFNWLKKLLNQNVLKDCLEHNLLSKILTVASSPLKRLKTSKKSAVFF